MLARMKTTIELPDALFAAAKQQAVADGTTLRALIEAGLRHVLDDRARAAEFRLRDGSYGAHGLTAEFSGAEWSAIRDAAYTGRGS
jgi:hypothetical protein